MPAAVIRRADADRIAENLRAHGRPVPDALKPPAPTRTAPARPAGSTTPTKPPAPHSIPTPRHPAPAPARAARRAPAHPAAAGRAGGRRGGRRGGILGGSGGSGDGGGVLLAIIAYPIALSVIRYGAKGPGMWLRAKFLNQDGGVKPGTAGQGKSSASKSPISAAAQSEADALAQALKPKTGQTPGPNYGPNVSKSAQGEANNLRQLGGK